MKYHKQMISGILGLLCTAALAAAPLSVQAAELTDVRSIESKDTAPVTGGVIPSGLNITNGSVPPESLPTGGVFSVRGLISSSYPLTRVWGGVYSEDGTPTAVYYEDAPFSVSYDLNATFDNYLDFGSLTPGRYVYRIQATDEQGAEMTALEQPFTVTEETAPSDIRLFDARYPTGNVREGLGYGIGGTIRSTYPLQSVTGGLYKFAWDSETPTDLVFTFNDIGTRGFNLSPLDEVMVFDQLAPGEYVYKIEATDVNGFTQLLEYRVFEVSSIEKTESSPEPAMRGIDLSSEQGDVDFSALYANGVDFVILRAAYTGRNDAVLLKDERFEEYYAQAKEAGLKVGAYLDTSAFNSTEMASNVADYLNILSGKELDLPAYLDVEASRQSPLGKQGLTELVEQGCKAITEGGFHAGVYSSMTWFANYLDAGALRDIDSELWVAYYPENPDSYDLSPFCVTWQYCSDASVLGVTGDVDKDYRYAALSEETHEIRIVQPELGTVTADRTRAASGERVTIRAQLDRVHKLMAVYCNGEPVAISGKGVFSFVMPEEDVEITVEIAECDPSQTVLEFDPVTSMPVPFGTATDTIVYHSKPCPERISSLPEAVMQLTGDGYSWAGNYESGKPAWSLTLMDYDNLYSFIHTHSIDPARLREVLSDGSRMIHRIPFTDEEIDILLGDDAAAAMAKFASPDTIVIGDRGYSPRWMYYHDAGDYAAAGITPEMVAAVQPYYYDPLYGQEAADAFSQKLFEYSGVLTQVKCKQWTAGDLNRDGAVNADDLTMLTDFWENSARLSFPAYAAADMNGDSTVNADDLALLQAAVEAGTPAAHSVELDVIEYCQYPDYPTGCESVSLYMLLEYYGVDVTVDTIYDRLPMGAQPYDDNGVRRGANPEREFVGNPRSSYSYGVFNEPVAGVAEQLKPGVSTKRGATLDEIRSILDTGNPVLAWYVTYPKRPIMYRWSWLDEFGELVSWPGGEHAIVICGYDADTITYRDPNAGKTVYIDDATFLNSFTELGSRIVYYTDVFPEPENPTPENPEPENPTPENPEPENPTPENPEPENPTPENPEPENPTPENPEPENPTPENPEPENPNTEEGYYASTEHLCEMAIQDYEGKTGIRVGNASAQRNEDGTLTIVLSDQQGSTLETYTIDPKTAVGTDSTAQTVDLPKTGKNHLTQLLLLCGAFLASAAGACLVAASGLLRRRKH